MRIRIEDGETKLESSCSSTATLSCVTTRDGNVVINVPKKGTFVVDVTVERVRAPLPEFARWDGDRTIRANNDNAEYGVASDGSVWGCFKPSGMSALVPAWALEAFRAEGLLKTGKESARLDLDWEWNKDIPPPVELPKGMRWCYDPHVDANSWDVISGAIPVGYVRRRLGEEYWVMLRRAHGRFTLESLRHKSIDACRELARLVATATDLYHVEREERPPAPHPAEWTWNPEVPPPVELTPAEMWWRYESVLDVWHVMSGNWPPVSLGYVRRDPSGHCFAFCRDKYAIHANAIDACRELVRVLRDRGRKGTEPCHEPGDELPSE